MTTVDKFLDLCYLISNDTGEKFDIWWDYLKIYENDDDYIILKNKITNFLKVLNEDNNKWMEKDIETEIYDLM